MIRVSTIIETPIEFFVWLYIASMFINLVIAVGLAKVTKDWTLIFYVLGGFVSWLVVSVWLLLSDS